MKTLDHLLPRPALDMPSVKRTAFNDLLDATLAGGIVDYRLPYPKWEFLSFLCETRNLVLHGSQISGIQMVEPRQARDVRAYSMQNAIYATTDGIWVVYFAILDRKNNPDLSLFNSCFKARISADQFSDTLYFFAITHSALLRQPWCAGTVYILPRDTFEQEPPQVTQEAEVVFPHWISFVPVAPRASLRVDRTDFPFLEQIHGFDSEKLKNAMRVNPNGFPWPEALES